MTTKTRTVIQDRTPGNPWEKRLTFGWEACMQLISFIASVMTPCMFIYQKILRVYRLEKVKNILYIYFFFGHSPTMVAKKYFRLKWTYFRKIYKGRLSFFLSWQHFLDTSRLTKILRGNTGSDVMFSINVTGMIHNFKGLFHLSL